MANLILRDARERPQVFEWVGSVEKDALTRWLKAERLIAPADLVALWQATGGGTVLESEEILVPVAGEERDGLDGDVPSVVSRTKSYRSRGLGAEYVIFEEGVFLSALLQPAGTIVTLDPRTLRQDAQFNSLDDWYKRTLRAAFAQRYNLRGPAK